MPLVAAIILAAGKSTRMRSRLPKTLHPLCGIPLMAHPLRALEEAGVSRRIVVVGHQAETVQAAMDAFFGSSVLEYALQAEQKGTGHAVQMAQPLLENFSGTVLVLPGDAPLISAAVLAELLRVHHEGGAAASILSAVLPNALSYGRIVRADSGAVLGIVEAKDANPTQKAIREINAGVYAFDASSLFAVLSHLRADNAQGELYLTDVIALLRESDRVVQAVMSPDADVTLGVNTRIELADLGQKMRHRILHSLMLSGVTIEDPVTTYVDGDVSIGQDSVLRPNTHIQTGTFIGEECVIGPNSIISGSRIGDGVHVVNSVVEKAEIANRVKIGPFARVRPGSRIGEKAKIGNFVEVKNAIIGEQVAIGHLSYIGDASIGAQTNIGAGTITCNYDGFAKHQTTIGEDTFIGSNTTLIAPVSVGDGAMTAAGSTISENVPEGSMAIARERQVNKEGREKRRRDVLRERHSRPINAAKDR